VTIPENVDNINRMIFDDGRLPAKKIAEALTISREIVGCISLKILDMRKL
jgi:hypothetical protein